jgi:hypothetical protein
MQINNILKKKCKRVKCEYLVVPKAAGKGYTWGLPDWPLFLMLKPSRRDKKKSSVHQ